MRIKVGNTQSEDRQELVLAGGTGVTVTLTDDTVGVVTATLSTSGVVSTATGDVTIAADTGATATGDIIFKTKNLERARITNAGIHQITPGANVLGLSIKAASTSYSADFLNVLSSTGGQVIRVGYSILETSSGGPAPFIAMFGANGAWSYGVDAAAATPGRDFFIAKVGGVDAATPGTVFDMFYIAHRGTSPPSIQIGTSSAFVPDGLVELIMTADGSGNRLDSAMSNLVIRTGIITGGTPQTAPAIRMRNWASASDRFLLDPDASLRIFDAGGTGLWSVQGTTGKTGIGKDAYNQSTDTLRLKENAADTTLTVASTSGGGFKVTAVNASATVNVVTTNASTLNVGVNNGTQWSMSAAAATLGLVTLSPNPTIAGGTTDMSLETSTPVIAGAFTVTRLNYMQLKQPTGAATITDACVLQFDAAIGTHKAVAAGTTKTSPGTVTAWLKININGTLHYVPAYASQTT